MSENVLKFPGFEQKPKEVFREVRTYVANAKCPQCEVGLMIAVSIQQMMTMVRTAGLNDFQKQPHQCNSCGHEASYTERYPTLRYFGADEQQPPVT
jgi:hypothetical protein